MRGTSRALPARMASSTRTLSFRRFFGVAGVMGIASLAALPGTGCLSRDVAHSSPTTSTIFSATVHNQAIDKVDLLFVIDNSASMGDKQQYLQQAVPDLLARLVNPNCVDPVSAANYGPSTGSICAKGQLEFPPVHDMHVGVLSTSLGARLGDQCAPSATVTLLNGTTLSNGNDDRGELLNRTGSGETPLADLGTSFYLNWFPSTPANDGRQPSPGAPPITDAATLQSDFTAMIQGIGTFGCGIESQLESWYRFLIQPDPYDSLSLDPNEFAQWVGVDTTILEQRHDFLRPDSLVAIIDLTDENDSEVDVRSFGGTGYLWMSTGFDPPRGTAGCDENPSGTGLVDLTSCTACLYASSAADDPSCQLGPYSAGNDWGYDLNLRHVHEKQKYGESAAVPHRALHDGLTSTTVPDRDGEYPPGAFSYQGLTEPQLRQPALRREAARRQQAPTPATLCNLPRGHAHRGPRLLRAHRRRAAPASAAGPDQRRQPAEGRRCRRGLGEDPRQGSGGLRLHGHRPAHGRVVPAAPGPSAPASPASGGRPRSRSAGASGSPTRAGEHVLRSTASTRASSSSPRPRLLR